MQVVKNSWKMVKRNAKNHLINTFILFIKMFPAFFALGYKSKFPNQRFFKDCCIQFYASIYNFLEIVTVTDKYERKFWI